MNPALYLLLLFDGDGEAAAPPATLVGVWANVVHVNAGTAIQRINTTAERTTIQATEE
jgi:hypothetical protein